MIPSTCVQDSRSAAPRAAPELRTYERVIGHAYLLGACIVFAVALTSSYVGRENAFYFWDQAVFQNLAARTAQGFGSSLAEGYHTVGQSLTEDYNGLFAVPLTPVLRRLGTTRLGYELSIALVYLLPFALVLGTISVAVIHGPRAAVFWTTAGIALLTPMTWVPGFRGYPDVGAALLVAVALRICLSDPTLVRPRSIVATGVLLAAAVLFRRHFLFAAAGLLATAALAAVVEARRASREPRQLLGAVLGAGLRILLTVAAGAAFALVVARPAALRFLRHDFYVLYTAYLNPRGLVAAWLVEPYGGLAVGGALLGFALAWQAGILEPRPTLFVLAFGLLSFVQWVMVVRQIGEQYTLQFTPLLVLGLASLVWAGWLGGPRRARALLAWAACAFLGANLLFGLGGAYELVHTRSRFRPLLAANWPPLIRWDHDEMARLVDALRALAQPDDPVFVVASSTTLNPDLLKNAERELHGWSGARLEIIDAPAIDSRDHYPLEPLLQARIVLLVNPLQTHLPPDQQKVVSVVHRMFTDRVEMARDFEELPGRFALQEDATAILFRRTRPTSLETGLGTLRYMQERFPTPPGAQPEWAVVSTRFPSWVAKRADSATTLTWHPALPEEVPAPIALYLGSAHGALRAAGDFRFLNGRCAGAALAFSFLGKDGAITDAAEIERRPGEPEAFTASFAERPESRLLLRLKPRRDQTVIDYCLLQVDSLTVSAGPAS
jgi:hypothetical protein